MFLSQVKIIDMKNSVLDDGGLEELRRKYVSLQLKLKQAKKEDRPKVQLVVDKAQEKYESAKKEFGEKKRVWLQNGRYKFKTKLEVDYKNKARRPYYFTKWVRYVEGNNFREAQDRLSQGWDFVLAGKDPFWPEMTPMGADGYYHFGGDMVLMKIPLYEYLLKRKEDIMRSDNAPKQVIANFQEKMRKQGTDIGDQMLHDILGK